MAYLDAPEKVEKPAVTEQVFEEKLGWLRQHRAALAEWGGVMAVVATTLTYARVHGYHARAERELAAQLPNVTDTSMRSQVT